MKTGIRSNPLLWAIAIAAVLPSLLSAPARADAMGPDMPAWTIQPYADPGDGKDADQDHVSTPVSDTLERTLASVAKADELVQSGKKSEAEAAIQSARLSLETVPRGEDGVKQVRDKLDDLARRCEAIGSRDKEKASDDADEGAGPPQLKGVKAERNDRVDKWLDYFTGRGRDQFQKYLSRSGVYMDLLTHNLRAEGVPEELANLVFVESGFNMHARSMARAVGPWQFIRGTAKIFGLQMTPYVDQRRDPELATRAAARYLRRLYEMFDGSWPLALAAYNSGEGTVQRAIKKQKTDDYWSLRLPRETQEYVPQFLAAMEIANDPERYGFDLPTDSPFRFDEVLLRGPVDLKLLSGITSIPLDDLKELNPMYVRHRAPAGAGADGTSIRVPKGKGDEVQELVQSYYKPKALTKAEIRDAKSAQRKELRYVSRRHHRGHGRTHVVRRGETLSGIGKRYGKATTTLARLNGLGEGGQVRTGQRLRIQ
ncbi:MAG TPA: transglycosylase SLT domain-containing protein [Candidatus Angelobacter sp.]|nr:transglycosylase SLT domain-containing protein [Candidatus Angelobacter sp.]